MRGLPASALVAMALLLLLAACGRQQPDPDGGPQPSPVGTPLAAPVDATIGPEGGVLTSADGRLSLTVPAGALAEDTTLSIQELSNTAPHGYGSAYRLGPDGLRFASPVSIAFAYAEALPTAGGPHGAAVAFQDEDGIWQAVLDSRLDEEAGLLEAQTTHFSDWTFFQALRIEPAAATVMTGASIELTVQSCFVVSDDQEDFLAPLLPTCGPLSLAPLIREVAVNGLPNGDAVAGRVSRTEGQPQLIYVAPGKAPAANPVAVSAQIQLPGPGRYLLVANVLVQDGACDDPWPGACSYDLVSVNGDGLPYGELPRENPFDNPEFVVAGRLMLDDADGDGRGNYTMRLTVREDREGDLPLEHVLGDAGAFFTEAGGSIRLESLTGEVHGARIAGRNVTVDSFPLWTRHAHLMVELAFAR